MNTGEAVKQLQIFVRTLVGANVRSAADWHGWRHNIEEPMAEGFGYVREDGMPSITTLVKPFFHPTLGLVGLNYTQVAHLTLHRFAKGWTDPLRLCRGIVFDRKANLLAFPFPKFFNYGEHEETRGELSDSWPREATDKKDGHLGIIFRYRGRLIATTRGSFVSASSRIANEMLAVKSRQRWKSIVPEDHTVLAEIIHPQTKVILDYGRRRGFELIGCYNNDTFADMNHAELAELASKLKIPVTELVPFASIDELKKRVQEKKFENREGYVVRFTKPDGSTLRVKFKCAGYLGKMLEDKLTYRYLMTRLLEGNLDKTLAGKPDEVEQEARRMAAKLMAVNDIEPDGKRDAARREYLLNLVPTDERTAYHKTVCGRFNTWAKQQKKS